METKDPRFLVDHQSVASLVTQLHEYFKNAYSHYEVERSTLMSKLHEAEGDVEQTLLQEICKLEAEISLFGVLSDSISIADRALHARTVMNELGLDNPIYRMHYDEDSKQAS